MGSDIAILDLRKAQGSMSDYLLLMSANSQVHLKTLRDAIEASLEQLGLSPLHRDGTRDSQWVAVDFGGLVVHIFVEEAREFYSLERLWLEAKPVEWDTSKPKSKPVKSKTKTSKFKKRK